MFDSNRHSSAIASLHSRGKKKYLFPSFLSLLYFLRDRFLNLFTKAPLLIWSQFAGYSKDCIILPELLLKRSSRDLGRKQTKTSCSPNVFSPCVENLL